MRKFLRLCYLPALALTTIACSYHNRLLLPQSLALTTIPFRSVFCKSVFERAAVLVVGALLAVRCRGPRLEVPRQWDVSDPPIRIVRAAWRRPRWRRRSRLQGRLLWRGSSGSFALLVAIGPGLFCTASLAGVYGLRRRPACGATLGSAGIWPHAGRSTRTASD